MRVRQRLLMSGRRGQRVCAPRGRHRWAAVEQEWSMGHQHSHTLGKQKAAQQHLIEHQGRWDLPTQSSAARLPWRAKRKKILEPFLEQCVSSLRRGHANLAHRSPGSTHQSYRLLLATAFRLGNGPQSAAAAALPPPAATAPSLWAGVGSVAPRPNAVADASAVLRAAERPAPTS